MEGRVYFAELLVTRRTITERPLRTARMDPVLELHRRERKGKTVGRKVAKVAIKGVDVARNQRWIKDEKRSAAPVLTVAR